MTVTTNVRLFAPPGAGGVIQTANSGNVFVQSDGTVTVNAQDAPDLIKLGYEWAVLGHNFFTLQGPAVGAVAATVTSTSLTVGTYAIAAQPDYPRQLAIQTSPGTTSITAGTLVAVYVANDGTTQTDSFSLVQSAQAAANTIGMTQTTTKGVEHVVSFTVSGLTGGTSPGIQVGTNNFLAMPLPPRFVDFAVTKETKILPTAGSLGLQVASDETIGSVVASGGLIQPTTLPATSFGLSFGYSYMSPG